MKYMIGEVGFQREQQAEEIFGVFARFSLRILTICHFGARTLPHQAPTTVNQADAGRLGNQSQKYHTTFSDTIPFCLAIKKVVITTQIPVMFNHWSRAASARCALDSPSRHSVAGPASAVPSASAPRLAGRCVSTLRPQALIQRLSHSAGERATDGAGGKRAIGVPSFQGGRRPRRAHTHRLTFRGAHRICLRQLGVCVSVQRSGDLPPRESTVLSLQRRLPSRARSYYYDRTHAYAYA